MLGEIEPLAVAWIRAAAAGLVFGLILLAREGLPALSVARLRRVLPLGLMGVFANQILFVEGLERTTPTHAALLVAMIPIHVLLLSVLFHQERLRPAKAGGVLVAFVGVALVALEKGFDLRSGSLAGDVAIFAGTVGFAGYTVAGKPVLRELGSLRTTALCFVTGGAAIALVAAPAAARQDWGAVPALTYAGLAYMVVLATIVSYLLYFVALARLDPSQVAVFAYLQPVIAALVAFVFAGEPLTPALLAGGVLVITGVALVERAR